MNTNHGVAQFCYPNFMSHFFLNCISLLYLIIIRNDGWPRGAISCNRSAVSINHKQSTHPFGVHIQLKVNLNGSYVNKVMGNSAHKVCSPKHSLPWVSFQFDICNQSHFIPYVLNEVNYNVSKQFKKVYLQRNSLKSLPWLLFSHKFIFQFLSRKSIPSQDPNRQIHFKDMQPWIMYLLLVCNINRTCIVIFDP